jgi:hypothetical protein
MSNRPYSKDIEMLTSVRDSLVATMERNGIEFNPARSLRRGEDYPNRGRDLPYQPRSPKSVRDKPTDPIPCIHGEPWLDCMRCSRKTK